MRCGLRVRGHLPAIDQRTSTYRLIAIDGAQVVFSEGFADLHTALYGGTLDGEGFGIDDARPHARWCDHATRLGRSRSRKNCLGDVHQTR